MKTTKNPNNNYQLTNKNKKTYPKNPTKKAQNKQTKMHKKTQAKAFLWHFASWQESYSSKPKEASGFEVNIAPEYMKSPMQKSTMSRLLEENYYLWGTIVRKVYFSLFSSA